jgi:NAD(P)-dependent dehydrogenase (short-subunit alcohol dehydrogenase family)
MRLNGKVAILTGAGRGLGRASAIAMAKEGASLVILSRTPSELRETAERIKAQGREVLSIRADVSKPGDIKKVVRRALSRFGAIDLLMNNAAIIGPLKPTFKIKEKEWDHALDINLRGAYLFSKAVIPHMIKQKRGKIINVISGLGEIVMPPFGAYSVAKAGLIHLTRFMAEELGDYNIQVNGLDPGIMDTRMQEEIRASGPEVLGAELYKQVLGWKERGELKPPEKVARLAVFLASAASDSFTGESGTETYYRKWGYRR